MSEGWRLLHGVNKETGDIIQEKYIDSIGLILCTNPLIYVPNDTSIGAGFITSDVIEKRYKNDIWTIETLNSIYIFERVEQREPCSAYLINDECSALRRACAS